MSILTASAKVLQPPTEELYVEIGALLGKHLTGIGRFIARLIEALSRHRPLRLINTFDGRLAEHMRLSKRLSLGEEIVVPPHAMPSADRDLKRWVERLLTFPRAKFDKSRARQGATLFTTLRPDERQSRWEMGILYDFCPVLLPWTQVEETRRYFERFYARSASLCDRVVAISRSTRQDASWLSPIPPDRIRVGYPGASLCVQAHASGRSALRNKRMILVVSTLEPRKNAGFLLDWFGRTNILDPGMELYWVGPRGWLSMPTAGSRHSPLGNRKVRFLGVVSDCRLCELYRQAAFTIYPSLYEGFGFPVLDSLRHQTPVACALHSSLQEFEGPGVYYFDPHDPASLEETCTRLLQERDRGFARNDLEARFSWEELAQEIIASCN
jgi:glycosyltransferase involved in cell wall biosynthesis